MRVTASPFTILAAVLPLALVGCAGTEPSATDVVQTLVAPMPSGTFAGLDQALAHPRRAEDAARDGARHPAETLRFFDVQPNHTVAEYAPGGGWYTRILAPYVAAEGQYVAVSFAGGDVPIPRLQKLLEGWETQYPANVEKMTGVPSDRIRAWVANAAPEEAHGTVDRILIPRMLHNLLRWNIAGQELRALRALLKDDGLVGVVQHRARPDATYGYADGNKGYLREADVVALMALHGFRLVGRSEINANPADPANHEVGVWALPPSFQNGDVDRDRYAAIGESDRATLLFAKAE